MQIKRLSFQVSSRFELGCKSYGLVHLVFGIKPKTKGAVMLPSMEHCYKTEQCYEFGFPNHLALITYFVAYEKWVHNEECPFKIHLP